MSLLSTYINPNLTGLATTDNLAAAQAAIDALVDADKQAVIDAISGMSAANLATLLSVVEAVQDSVSAITAPDLQPLFDAIAAMPSVSALATTQQLDDAHAAIVAAIPAQVTGFSTPGNVDEARDAVAGAIAAFRTEALAAIGAAAPYGHNEVRWFVPAADGSPPVAGFTWLDGILSNGYDQGHALSDSANLSTFYSSPQAVSYDGLTTVFYDSEGVQTGTFVTLPAVRDVYVAYDAAGAFEEANCQSSITIKPSGIADTLALSSDVTDVKFFVPHPTEAERYLALLSLADGTLNFTSFSRNEAYETVLNWITPIADPYTARFCALDATHWMLGTAYVFDLTDGTVVPVTSTTTNPDMVYVVSASLEHNRVLAVTDYGGALTLGEMTLAGPEFVFTPVTGTTYRSDSPWVFAHDKSVWSFSAASVMRIDANGVFAQVAGRHPAYLAMTGDPLITSVTYDPTDVLGTVRLTLKLAGPARGDGSGNFELVGDGQFYVNLGALIASFQRKAFFTGA